MVFCVICRQHAPRWLPHPEASQTSEFIQVVGTVGSDLHHYQCPNCGCNDRDRHLWLYFHAVGLVDRVAGARVLHLAPERALVPLITALSPAVYVRGDLHPSSPGVQAMNAQALPFEDGCFDLIICNHVLEHVSDPEQALQEFRRCLVAGGLLVAQTPYAPRIKNTLELVDEGDEGFNTRYFGQADHVRLFGADVRDYFHRAGLSGELIAHDSLLADVDPAVYGCNRHEPLFAFFRA
jgi:SAM-dependent methyltransferase